MVNARTCLCAVVAATAWTSGTAFVVPTVHRPAARATVLAPASTSAWGTTCATTAPKDLSMSTTMPELESTSSDMSSGVQGINSLNEFIQAFSANQDKLVVVQFWDKFCRACSDVAPRYQSMVHSQGKDVVFYNVEFSRNKDLCKQVGIRRLPTVQVYAGSLGKMVDQPSGPTRFHDVEEKLEAVRRDPSVQAALAQAKSS